LAGLVGAVPRPAPLTQSPLALRHYAYPNDVVGVPMIAHQRYLARLLNAGIDRADAERQLFDWYDSVCREWRGQIIGDRELSFWDKRFEERHGTSASGASSMTGRASRAADVLRRRRQR
jgi:hypothetical protein